MRVDPARLVALDFETYKIEPGLLSPRIVCGSVADRGSGARLLARGVALSTAIELLESDSIICGANIAYDFGCLAADNPDVLGPVFRAYERGRIFDIQIAQALHAIAEGNLYLDPRTGQELQTVNEEGKKRRGRYSLERCVDLVLGRLDAKRNDFWRRRYAYLERVPIAEWPQDAKQYPVDDAANTLEVATAQVSGGGIGCTPGPHRNLGDLTDQAETAFAMHLGAVWGLRTDRERYDALRRRTEEAHASFVLKFKDLGFFDADGGKNSRAIKRAVIVAYGGSEDRPCPACVEGRVISPKSGNLVNCTQCSGTGLDATFAPRTKAGGVAADRDTLAESGDPDLIALGDNEPEKLRDTYLPYIAQGLERPITLRPNILLASGRTSYDGVIQLFPREGGARECIVARPGYVLCSVDFAAMELCTLAQFCLWVLGRSQMAETINATGDPGALHTALGARLIGITTEEMAARILAKDPYAKRVRQAAKKINFGLPGGMGPAKFVFAQRRKSEGETECADGFKYPGIRFCVLLRGAERCGRVKVTEWNRRATPAALCRDCVEIVHEELRPAWFKQWPEMAAYFAWVKGRVDAGGEMPCLPTERVRGGCDFPNGANNSFQALAADAAKRALRAVTRECYLDRSSFLWGSRPVFFAHDEIMSELVESRASAAAQRKAQVMVSAARELVTDVCVRAEPALMRRWIKSAEPHWVDGELKCWDDYHSE